MNSRLSTAMTYALSVILAAFSARMTVGAQALTVLPVNISMAPGERASTLTVTNQGNNKTAIQIRVFAWSQDGDEDKLISSDDVVVSPPIASLAPGGSQVIRLILRKTPQSKEATYRILLDQIPPPAEPGVVHVVLRLSIPVFAQPLTRTAAHCQFRVEVKDGQATLVGNNDGNRHLALHEVEIWTPDVRRFQLASGSSPYLLAGSTRHWKIAVQGSLPIPNDILQLKAQSDTGAIEQQVSVVSAP
jgi:fimbrial chaperone protein